MKTHSIFFICLGVAFSLFACKSPVTQEEPMTDIIVVDSARTLSLQHETLPITPIGLGDVLIADSLLILFQNSEDNLINVYNLSDLKLLGSCFKKGDGPDDVILPGPFGQWFKKKEEVQLMVRSYQTYVGMLNITQSLAKEKAVFDEKYTFRSPNGKKSFQKASWVYALGDSLFLINRSIIMRPQSDPNDLFEIYDYRTDSVVRSFYATDFPDIFKTLRNGSPFFDKSVEISKDRKQLVIAYRGFPLLSIVDIANGKVLNLHIGGEKVNWEKGINNPKECFTEIDCNDRYIWASSLDESSSAEYNSCINVFDWKGKYLYKIHLDKRLSASNMDEKNGYMYAITTNDTLVRYDMKELLGRRPH